MKPLLPILLIGETCTDKTTWCSSTRNSPEDASVPVWSIDKQIIKPGMVRIVAEQFDRLEVPYTLLTNISGEIVKNRVFVNDKQVARIDEDNKVSMETFSFDWFRDSLRYNRVGSIVVSDYGKGFVSKEVIDLLNNSGLKIYLDPHPNNNIFQYKNVFMVKLNIHEAKHFTDTSTPELAAQKLINSLSCKHVFITLGEKGIFYSNGVNTFYLPSQAIDVKNVAGAGDCVLATLVASLEKGFEPIKAAEEAMRVVGNYVSI